tara:strand:- start:398 stop:748 length:351 start_codon:yes stop_codon:yes gene_type:complete
MIDYFYCDTEPYAENGGDDINERQQTEKKNTNYLCTVLELCSGGSLYDIIDWYGTLPEELAAQVRKKYQAVLIIKSHITHTSTIATGIVHNFYDTTFESIIVCDFFRLLLDGRSTC